MVFIVSAGRTGTKFFGDKLSSIIFDAFSVHEPDVVFGFTKATYDRIGVFGWYHMVFGRLLTLTGIRNLSRKHLSGELAKNKVITALHRHRDGYYGSIASDLIIESNPQWYGLLQVLPELYENQKIVAVIRDPRTWVTSVMNFGTQFGWRDWVMKLGFRRLDPALLGDREYMDKWADMSAFEKNCWHWATVNSLIKEHVGTNPNARLFRYEDLFLAEDRDRHLRDMLDFMTTFPDRRFRYELDSKVLGSRRNASTKKKLSDWRAWDSCQAGRLQEMCGPLMKEFGYGTEPEWQDLLG